MSAAESAHPGPGLGPLATVHHLTSGTTSRPRRHRSSERTPVPPTPDGDPTRHHILAVTLEDLFARKGRSLTDEVTAEDFLTTLRAVLHLLEGALRQGILDETAHQDLKVMIEGMMQAPSLLG